MLRDEKLVYSSIILGAVATFILQSAYMPALAESAEPMVMRELYFISTVIPAAITSILFLYLAFSAWSAYRIATEYVKQRCRYLVDFLFTVALLGANTALGWGYFWAVGSSVSHVDIAGIPFYPFPYAMAMFFVLFGASGYFLLRFSVLAEGESKISFESASQSSSP